MHPARTMNTSYWRALYFYLANEVEQVLGKALGYPKYSEDQKNFPGTTEADGVCTGDHVPESLLAEAAQRLSLDMLKPKPLTFKEFENTPCTAELEVNLEKLATYFERRARENKRRAEKLEKKINGFHDVNEYLDSVKSSYYFSGKDDTYTRAAQKVRELLSSKEPDWVVRVDELKKPEEWIIECLYKFRDDSWSQSIHFTKTFASKEEAQAALDSSGKKISSDFFYYRVSSKEAQ